MILADAANEMSGTCFSPTTSITASAAGVIDGPMMTSTLFSSISLRASATALVTSVASSSTMYSTLRPAISVGSSATVLRWGMPSDAAGPVCDVMTPMRIGVSSAHAGSAAAQQKVANATNADRPKPWRIPASPMARPRYLFRGDLRPV